MTYFKGIDTPDREPSRNRFADPKRKSKFTEKVAGTVVDGDLYFSLRSNATQRFYVPVEKGEHGQEESGLLCVTHQFRQPFPDIDGRWHAYDGGGNLVIKVRKAADDDLVFEAMQAIEQALYVTPLGRAVGRDALRAMAESLCKTFGIEDQDAFNRYGESASTFTVNPHAEKLAQDALRDLLTFAPEGGYAEELGAIGAEADGVGFASDGVAYASLINGESDGFDGDGEGQPLPFLSQPVFYAVLGYKGNGRAFQARIDALKQAVGLTEDDLR
jgi:hypothetical protein